MKCRVLISLMIALFASTSMANKYDYEEISSLWAKKNAFFSPLEKHVAATGFAFVAGILTVNPGHGINMYKNSKRKLKEARERNANSSDLDYLRCLFYDACTSDPYLGEYKGYRLDSISRRSGVEVKALTIYLTNNYVRLHLPNQEWTTCDDFVAFLSAHKDEINSNPDSPSIRW